MIPVKFVFDLDDTLYKEADYARSALAFAARRLSERYGIADQTDRLISLFQTGERDPLGLICQDCRLPFPAFGETLNAMRAHEPAIRLSPDAAHFIARLRERKPGLAIVTDGRSITQRAKIRALGLTDADPILISEETGFRKPEIAAFQAVEDHFPGCKYIYIADNPAKDFIAPNALGWHSVMLADDGRNLHPQDIAVPENAKAAQTIQSLAELAPFLAA